LGFYVVNSTLVGRRPWHGPSLVFPPPKGASHHPFIRSPTFLPQAVQGIVLRAKYFCALCRQVVSETPQEFYLFPGHNSRAPPTLLDFLGSPESVLPAVFFSQPSSGAEHRGPPCHYQLSIKPCTYLCLPSPHEVRRWTVSERTTG